MSGEVIIRIAGTAASLYEPGIYLQHYEVDAGGELPAPVIQFTGRRDEAMRFTDARAAMECWRRQSAVMPLRRDGQPNRPLTAYSIEIVPADAEETPCV